MLFGRVEVRAELDALLGAGDECVVDGWIPLFEGLEGITEGQAKIGHIERVGVVLSAVSRYRLFVLL